MAREKLTDDKIALMEEWADSKKKTAMTDIEQSAVSAIDGMRKNNWSGQKVKNDSAALTPNEAEANLKRLKEKKI